MIFKENSTPFCAGMAVDLAQWPDDELTRVSLFAAKYR
jgi:hypothetical protein